MSPVYPFALSANRGLICRGKSGVRLCTECNPCTGCKACSARSAFWPARLDKLSILLFGTGSSGEAPRLVRLAQAHSAVLGQRPQVGAAGQLEPVTAQVGRKPQHLVSVRVRAEDEVIDGGLECRSIIGRPAQAGGWHVRLDERRAGYLAVAPSEAVPDDTAVAADAHRQAARAVVVARGQRAVAHAVRCGLRLVQVREDVIMDAGAARIAARHRAGADTNAV